MIVITDVSVPAEAFVFGDVFSGLGDVEIEFERIVPLNGSVGPLFWVRSGAADDVEELLRADQAVTSVRQLTRADDRTLFEVAWRPDENSLLGVLVTVDARLYRARTAGDAWNLRVQFPDRAVLSAFRRTCEERGIDVTLRRLFNPSLPERDSALSPEQYRTIRTAYDEGYFEVPRRVTLSDLADRFGISDNAVSQRLRRGLSTLVEETLVESPY